MEVLVKNDQGKHEFRKYTKKLLNEENSWDNATTCENVEGPCELIRRGEILKALRLMKMFIAEGGCSVEWLTPLYNLIVAQGKIPNDWRSSILLPFFKGKGNPMECGTYRAIKLLEHAMKVIEHVFERRIREKVKSDAMHFQRPHHTASELSVC